MRAACGDAHLKAILGTGDLKTLRNVYRASMVAMMAGADFIKTSTGKEDVNATLPVSLVMVRAHPRLSRARPASRSASSRPAASRRPRTRSTWLILMKEELGRDWLEPDLFRIGALDCSPTSSASSSISSPAATRPSHPPRAWLEDPRHDASSRKSSTHHGLRPGAGGERPRCAPGWTQHAGRLRAFHRRRIRRAGRGRATSTSSNPARGKRAGASVAQGTADGCRRGGRGGAQGAQAVVGACAAIERARHLYAHRPHAAEARALLRRARDDRQRQADPRDAATSTSRWSRGTSTITPAGPQLHRQRVSRPRRRSASAARSSRGISRC